MKEKIWWQSFCLFDLRAILCTSFAVFCVMGLAEPHGSGFCVFQQHSPSERHRRELGLKGAVRLFPLSHCPRPFSSLAPASLGQPILPLARLTPGSPLLQIQLLMNSPHLWYLVMIPACRSISGFLLQISELPHLHILCRLSPSLPV